MIFRFRFFSYWAAIASLPPSLHHSHLAMHHHHHHNALIPNGLVMSSNLNNNSIQTNNNNITNKLTNNHQSANSTKNNNNNSNSNDTEHHRHHNETKTGLLSSNNSSSNSPNHLSSRPVTPGTLQSKLRIRFSFSQFNIFDSWIACTFNDDFSPRQHDFKVSKLSIFCLFFVFCLKKNCQNAQNSLVHQN